MTFRVFIAEPIHTDGIARLSQACSVTMPTPPGDTEAFEQAAASADVLIVRLRQVDPRLMDGSPNLKAVIKHGIGVDNIDIDAATARGILVANTPSGPNAATVAEMAVAMMLATIRRLRDRHDAVVGGRYSESRIGMVTGTLTGKTVGVIGFGQIGRIVARICRDGFGCRVLAHDPWAPESAFAQSNVERVAILDELLRQADAVTVHVPLTKDTRHLIGKRELGLMKSSAVLVNTARGGIVDEDALASALADNSIGGAGIDAFEQEPPSLRAAIVGAPKTLFSPHVAGVSDDSLRDMALAAADATISVMDGRLPATALNPQVWPDIRPSTSGSPP